MAIYTVQDGDTLSAIAGSVGLRWDTLRWSNNLDDPDTLALGQKLVVPAVNGLVVPGDGSRSIREIAAAAHADPDTVAQYNGVTPDTVVESGSDVVVPDGTGAAPPQPRPSPNAPSAPRSQIPIRSGGSAYNHFPWGQCTWLVASIRNIPWNGNAWEWFGAAKRYGLATGSTPAPGAIMVTWENRYYGHVAYVESVHADGSWTVREMNYRGFGIVDERTIRRGQVPLIGFIY